MANDLFPTAREALLGAGIDWASDDFVVALLSDTMSEAERSAVEFFDDLTAVEGSEVLTGMAILAGGVADADDVSVAGVPLSTNITSLVIYKDTGSPATSPLLYYADFNEDGTPISRVGDGGNIPVVWSSGADRIFRL